jgi:hypothetical protein
MKDWLIKNKNIFKIKQLEKQIGCPPDTLQKVVQGRQGLPGKWEAKLRKFLKDLLKTVKVF